MRAIERLRQKESAFASTWNHRYAKELVDVCLKNRVGLIHLEDLSGLGQAVGGMLRHWSYHDLQTKVEQKAGRFGITVIKVDARYTSQTCRTCGHQDKEQRTSRDVFACNNPNCVTFGKKTDADFNAAVNIARGVPVKAKEAYVA